MAAKTEPRRLALLLALLLAVAVLGVMQWRPRLLSGSSATGPLPQVRTYTVPELGWSRLGSRELPTPGAGRNLFTFGPPPTPTPDRRPTPTPLPTRPSQALSVRPTPTPGPPPPPPFTLTYLGWLGPDRLPVAIFRDGEEVIAAARGDTLKQKFIIRDVKATSVTVGYVGWAETVTTEVPLAR